MIQKNLVDKFLLVILITAIGGPSLAPIQVSASEHIDSPTIAQDRGADLTDMYAFLDPNDSTKVVLIMSTQGFIVPGEHFGEVIFDHNIRYRFEIENTGDAKPDKFIDVYYSPGVGRLTTQTARIVLPNGRQFTALTTLATQELQPTPPPTPVVTTDRASGVSFFAGGPKYARRLFAAAVARHK